ncbi:AAA family ATPase [Lactiplantibacillus plantarum]|uniref:AAA family ATPase n=1 Tax=Lactiplantibacillus plantarum TaxID=1590 RepID=UPI0006A5E270|nr:AAA family ATPase [Lactiplantibacillus plantarum]ASD31945.1 hypothetical protein CEF05_04515 [Lactiplantibacillus plantarum]AXI13192.1 hypothetical protein C6I22_10715 [Lactiplantibacillus plantarum]KOE71370.1 hypothetical protein AB662_12645 [Lactiplantibacillus plantarum]MBW4800162.1 AAA family ATPase [Lactiplantibacillus plantarum]MBW4808152.1 AAA family ATPase [Lactiplantibacillus plantarum]
MRILIDKIKINKFRKFSELGQIHLGHRITVLSGHNGVGKSSIMSLISSTVGQNKVRLNGSKFQPEFNDYFTIDPEREEHDFPAYEILVDFISQTNTGNYEFAKRVGFKDDRNQDRGIRPLPRPALPLINKNGYQTISQAQDAAFKMIGDIIGKSGSSRVHLPCIYISLSRIMPPGETTLIIEDFDGKTKKLSEELSNKYVEWYNEVLPNSINENSIIAKSVEKKSTGKTRLFILLADATASTQSVGQDNLGGIISALVDFYYLSKTSDDYNGGVLCIDEIEASLHPNAQLKLMLLLDKLSQELKLQILITSHSLTILKEILIQQSKSAVDYQLVYFKGETYPYASKIDSYRSLKADLFNEITVSKPYVKIYCEDEFTVPLLNHLLKAAYDNEILSKSLPEYKIINVALGKDNLRSLIQLDSYFSHVLIVLDGDAKLKDRIKIETYFKNPHVFEGRTERNQPKNVLTLPGFMSPEEFSYVILWEYVNNESQHLQFWRNLERNQDLALMTADKAREAFTPKGDQVKFKDIHDKHDLKLLDFIGKSNILSDYYSLDDNQIKLKDWINSFKKILVSFEKDLKAMRY